MRDDREDNCIGNRRECIQPTSMIPIKGKNYINKQLEVCYECTHGQGFRWCSRTVVKVLDGNNIVVNGRTKKMHKPNEAVMVRWDATKTKESCVASQVLKPKLYNQNNQKDAWRYEKTPIEIKL